MFTSESVVGGVERIDPRILQPTKLTKAITKTIFFTGFVETSFARLHQRVDEIARLTLMNPLAFFVNILDPRVIFAAQMAANYTRALRKIMMIPTKMHPNAVGIGSIFCYM